MLHEFLSTHWLALLIGLLNLAFALLVLPSRWLPTPRKLILPALLLAVLPLAYLLLPLAFPSLTAWFYQVVPTAGPAASGAEVVARQQASGLVPFATIGSKLLAALVAYVLFSWVPFKVQGITHPAPTKWAKGDYTADFDGLSVGSKFEVYSRLQLGQKILVAAVLLFGALVI